MTFHFLSPVAFLLSATVPQPSSPFYNIDTSEDYSKRLFCKIISNFHLSKHFSPLDCDYGLLGRMLVTEVIGSSPYLVGFFFAFTFRSMIVSKSTFVFFLLRKSY